METLEGVLQERLDGMERDGGERACRDQRHLDHGTEERAYWHHGYASALKDVLRILQSAHGPAN
jgi:hypothetical protein